jgi:hypothetical protein
MNKNLFLTQLDKILSDHNSLKAKATHKEDLSGNIEVEEILELVSKSKAAVVRIVGDKSEYYKDIFDTMTKNVYVGVKLNRIIGTIKALKADLQNDYLKSLFQIIHSEVFSDYLEMAAYLIEEGYKDPSAVIAGSTLESHLRELCKIRQIDIEVTNSKGKIVAKKAEAMNSDLSKAQCYSLTFQKQITAWLDLRNNAAHGKYDSYTVEEVKLMIAGIRNFIITVSY